MKDSLTGKLRGTGAHKRDKTGNVDDASTSLEAFRWVGLVFPHSQDSVFATIPYTFHVDVHGEVPDRIHHEGDK